MSNNNVRQRIPGRDNIRISELRADNLCIAIRPRIQKGYKTSIVCMSQIILALVYFIIGLLECFISERYISGIICCNIGIILSMLWFPHFIGWKYNSAKLLIIHTIGCTLLGLSFIIAVLIILFNDLFNGHILDYPHIRYQIDLCVIESIVTSPILFLFGTSSWNHAQRDKMYSDARRRYLFAMKALESYILQRIRFKL